MLRERLSPPTDKFPVNPWALESVAMDRRLEETFAGQIETMFALSNGYLGLRGTWDEGVPVFEPGVFLNGFYEYRPISYGEHAYGFPRRGQSILNCPDGTIIRLFVDDEPFVVTLAEVSAYHRALDLKRGVICRDVTWVTPFGHRMRLRSRRLVSLARRHLVAIDYELWSLDAPVNLVVCSELRQQQPLPDIPADPRVVADPVGRVLQPLGAVEQGMRVVRSYVTECSRLLLGCGMDHRLEAEDAFASECRSEPEVAAVTFHGQLQPGRRFRLQKFLSYHYTQGGYTQGDAGPSDAGMGGGSPEEIRCQTGWTLDDGLQAGFERLLESQQEELARYWTHADIEIDSSDERLQQVVRWNLFQLLQATARCEGHGVPARGLTGRTYEGHYFWDMEIYILPFLIYQEPRIARSILKFRYDCLDQARARAQELGHRGATFPWRTVNGEEASAYYAAGTAQYHINADIAFALRKYVEVSGDRDFLIRFGAEILVETARFWWDLGFFSERKEGRFCINGVTGPDEYTAIVNNNYFTNLMARENLRYAVKTLNWLESAEPAAFRELVRRTGLAVGQAGEAGEAADWARAAEAMYLPYDERLRVHPQDDSFLDKELWDFTATPEESYPLLLHYHPLNLYRAQIIKQADTLLAMFLLGDQFGYEDKKRNFDYYDPLTTHDSSLSVCIQSIVANEIGYREKAARYFRFAAVMDLSDVGGNVKHGAHIASIGGTWLALVYGFAGMRDHGGDISFAPCLPADWRRLRFCLLIRGTRLAVEIRQGETRYRLCQGESLSFSHVGEALTLTAAAPEARRPNPRPAAVEPGSEFRHT